MTKSNLDPHFFLVTGFKQFLTADIEEPDQLACDWVARNIYWTDGMLGRIEVARLDGTARKVIISKNLQRPRGLAIDAADAYVWTLLCFIIVFFYCVN